LPAPLAQPVKEGKKKRHAKVSHLRSRNARKKGVIWTASQCHVPVKDYFRNAEEGERKGKTYLGPHGPPIMRARKKKKKRGKKAPRVQTKRCRRSLVFGNQTVGRRKKKKKRKNEKVSAHALLKYDLLELIMLRPGNEEKKKKERIRTMSIPSQRAEAFVSQRSTAGEAEKKKREEKKKDVEGIVCFLAIVRPRGPAGENTGRKRKKGKGGSCAKGGAECRFKRKKKEGERERLEQNGREIQTVYLERSTVLSLHF